MVQLRSSSNPGVCKVAEIDLDQERVSQRRVFKLKPATLVAELRASNHSQSQNALAGAAKTLIAEEEADQWQTALCELPAQGDMARKWGEASPDIWVKAVKGLPPETRMHHLTHCKLTTTFTSGVRSHQSSAQCARKQSSLFCMS